MKSALAVGAAAAALALIVSGLPVAGATTAAARAEVLQTVFHPITSAGWTHQDFSVRCVLVEQRVDGSDATAQDARAAVDSLLNSTTRRELAYAEFGAGDTRFHDYYQLTLNPTALFDGLGIVAGGGPQAQVHAQAAFDEAARRLPRASINVSSSTAVTTGVLNYEVFAPLDLTGYSVSIKAMLVEDLVYSADAGRELRYFVRQYLAGDRLELHGNTTATGILEFGVDASWVASRLAAVVFVQVDAIPAVPLPAPPERADLFAAVVVPLAALATGATLAVMFARYISAERRARLR